MDTIEITKDKLTTALKKYAKATELDLPKVALEICIKDGKPFYQVTDEYEQRLEKFYENREDELFLKEIFQLSMIERGFVKGTIDGLYLNIENFLINAFARFAADEKDIKGNLHAFIKIRKIGNEPEAFLCDDEKFIRKIEIHELIKTE